MEYPVGYAMHRQPNGFVRLAGVLGRSLFLENRLYYARIH